MEWENLRIGHFKYKFRAHPLKGLEFENYDLENNLIAQALTNIADPVAHFFTVLKALLEPSNSPQVLHEILLSYHHDFLSRSPKRIKLAKNPLVLARATFHLDDLVIRNVAKNTSTHPLTLIHLSKHPYWVYRSYVASNPACPVEVLAKLALDPEVEVRDEVANNQSSPLETLRLLAFDSDEFNALSAIDNPVFSLEEVQKLNHLPSYPYKEAIANAIEKKINYEAGNSSNSNRLREIYQIRAPWREMFLASNANTPPDILELLTVGNLNGAYLGILQNLAVNPSLSKELFAQIIQVLPSVAISLAPDSKDLSKEKQFLLLSLKDPQVDYYVALTSQCVEILETLSSNSRAKVRKIATRSLKKLAPDLSTPTEIAL